MRGEHVFATRENFHSLGSSPHARGALRERGRQVLVAGIIPACAGSTGAARRGLGLPRDHPRMRGEHRQSRRLETLLWGSSPHARGALKSMWDEVTGWGIIPACAGSTLIRLAGLRQSRDHPRMRGEHLGTPSDSISAEGSSPHARGALALRLARRVLRGIIPACAGSTGLAKRHFARCRDHPRMRGEHRALLRSLAHDAGSSPHARGARESAELPRDFLGIIPACAGSTQGHCQRV